MGYKEEVLIEEEFTCIRIKNDSDDVCLFQRENIVGIIQFHFLIKGKAVCLFNNSNYKMEIKEEQHLVLYNPEKELPIALELEPQSWMVSILIPIIHFHSLFSSEAGLIPFLSSENKDKKYYSLETISPSMAITLNQIMSFYLNNSVKKLYYKAKVYELLSLAFNKLENPNVDACPFITDEETIRKIKKVKDLVIEKMLEPPLLQDLADEVDINIKKLKNGFKQVYGDTVFGFLFDYKMEYARKLLDSRMYNVNEVGNKIGYSTASHFIAAFKKKFGITPKKYLMTLGR